MKCPNVVYHVTRLKNRKLIVSRGLLCKSSEVDSSYIKLHTQKYSDRVYLALDLESAERAAEFLSSYLDFQEIFESTFLCVEVRFLDYLRENPDIRVFKDPDFHPGGKGNLSDFTGRGGIYIKKDIPPEYIAKVSKITIG